ncbi:MAG TPA: SIMPL domain-containing protein [Verrucomicrobiae bacterium]|nr:SIMPL domain-containing protein [Verrucomicrobiae bacterium]
MDVLTRHAGPLLALILLPAAALAHDAPPPRVVAVNGQGEVAVKPDRARLHLSIEKIDPDLKRAEAEVNKVVRDFVREAKALGAKDEQLATSDVSINPEYVWPEGARERKFTGYRVMRQIEVRIDNLDRLGDYILRATQVGVNQVSPPALESSKATEVERQALVKAAEDARGKARLLAETLGVKLGVLARVTESGVSAPPVMYEMKAMRAQAADGNAEMGMQLGEIRYRASVSAEFDLLPP